MVYVVLDDVGFGALGCYGGLIDTPNIDRIAAAGLRYTQWHTTALCSPTRSCLLTGRNHTTNGMACITEAATGFPNGNGHVPPECATLPEVLVERGISTAMVGKWHLCAQDEMNLAASKRNWPIGRGFERFYGFLGAETNQWYPDLVHDNHPVDPPATPAEGYHLSVDLTDKAIEFIDDVKTIAPERPVFLYYALGAAHAPHHVPREWADRYKGRFDMGYEAAREQILARQKELGIVPGRHRAAADQPDRHSGARGAAPTASRSPRWTTRSRGTACRTTNGGCSPGWPRSTPGSCPTPTPRSAGCSTTSSRSASWTTRSSSSSPTTGRAARGDRTARSTRTSSSTASPTTWPPTWP